jgi:hypothetical protein
MDPLTDLGCLIIYAIYSLFKGKPNYIDSPWARNFRKLRSEALKNVSGLREVKAIKIKMFQVEHSQKENQNKYYQYF